MTLTHTTNPSVRSKPRRKATRRRLATLVSVFVVTMAASTSPAAATTPADRLATSATPSGVSLPYSDEGVQAALDRLRASGMLFDNSGNSKTDFTLSHATTFGRALFNGVAFVGGQVVMSEVLTALGYDPDSEMTSALREISDSIAALNDEVRRISQQVEQLLEGQDRSNFYDSYTQSGLAAANLDTAMRSVNGWIERDLSPSEANLSDIQTIVTASIGKLDFVVTNPTTGTVPLMMKSAEPAGVSDLEDYWRKIDQVRDDYRAVLAQGLAALSMMERWDTSGTIAADLDSFTPRALTVVEGMYGYGVSLGSARLHARGSQALLLDLGTTPVSGETGVHDVGTRGETEPVLQALAANYRPPDHGGQSLESVLRSHGMPTAINYSDTYTAEPRNNRWTSLNLVGRISGNTYEVVERHFGNTYSPLDPNGAGSAFAQTRMQQHRDGPSATRVQVNLNVGGRAADFTPGVLKEAAFGLD